MIRSIFIAAFFLTMPSLHPMHPPFGGGETVIHKQPTVPAWVLRRMVQ